MRKNKQTEYTVWKSLFQSKATVATLGSMRNIPDHPRKTP